MPVVVQQFVPNVALPSPLYFDANTLVAFVDDQHVHNVEAVEAVGAAIAQGSRRWISHTVLQEFWHALLSGWRFRDDGIRKVTPTTVTAYANQLEQKTDDLLGLDFEILPTEPAAVGLPVHQCAIQLMRDRSLLPRDSLHGGYALRHQAAGLMTIDGDYRKLAGLAGYNMVVLHIATGTGAPAAGAAPVPAGPP